MSHFESDLSWVPPAAGPPTLAISLTHGRTHSLRDARERRTVTASAARATEGAGSVLEAVLDAACTTDSREGFCYDE